MRLHLLHGPGRVGSRNKLINIKKGFDPNNTVVFEEGAEALDIINNLSSASLFSEERLVILDNPDIDSLQSSVFSLQSGLTLILWFDHELSDKSTTLKWVKENEGEILFFPESKEVSVFPFLDLLAGGNIKAFLEMKKLKMDGYDIFYFNTMVIYLLRNLVNTPKNAPHFVTDKLQRQRKNFDLEKITKLYKDILELDFKLKSGLIESEQAEFLLVNKFLNPTSGV